jgi:hypothetical protein
MNPLKPILTTLLLLACSAAAYGADTFDPPSNRLNIPSVLVGGARYSNVVVTPGQVLSVLGGTPSASMDSYYPASNQLAIPSVMVNGVTYTNVLITVGNLLSVGSVLGADSYNGAQLSISSVQLPGGAVYNNAVITVGSIIGVGGGMPTDVRDSYNPANKQLFIPSVQVLGGRAYTNVTISLGTIVSVPIRSRFDDASVAGLCYSTTPSATSTASATNGSGEFFYVPGDIVTFWVDGTGSGCLGTTEDGPFSISLGDLLPTGSHSFVLALTSGLQAADTLTALNIGSASVMDVGGLFINGSVEGPFLSQFIQSQGAFVPGGGSIDNFFHNEQASAELASSSAAPIFVTPVAANASTTNSVLENTVSTDLLATAANLPGQPTSISIPAGGELRFAMSAYQYTCPVCIGPTAVYTDSSAFFFYFDGKGNVMQLNSPGIAEITTSNLADQTESGSYSINGSVFALVEAGTRADNGYAVSYNQTFKANYADPVTLIGSGPFTESYTSGPYSGVMFATGATVFNAVHLTPLTLSMLAGRTIGSGACDGAAFSGTLTFVGIGPGPSSVTMTSSCGQLPLTLTPSAMPGILEATDSGGFIAYLGLYGAQLADGAEWAVVQEAQGGSCLNGNCNGSDLQWRYSRPFSSVAGPGL